MDPWYTKAAVACAVIALHAAVLGVIFFGASEGAGSKVNTSGEVVATAEIIQLKDVSDKIPIPDLQLLQPRLDPIALQEIRFDESIDDELGAIVGAVSTPRLARIQSVDPMSFACRAHLSAGGAVTAVVRVDVMEDGLADSVDIIQTSGNAAADSAAVEYALQLRWIPGTIERMPSKMRVRLPVTLAIPVDSAHSCTV
jgi:TonB family protein